MKTMATVKSLFYPHHCVVCDCVVKKDACLCEECRKLLLPYKPSEGCHICGLPLDLCACSKYLLFEKSVTPLFYRDAAANAVQRMKFSNRTDKVAGFAQLMYGALQQRRLLTDIDVITFIPMRKIPEFFRGYNQAQLLAKELSKISGIECRSLLYKYFSTPRQHTLRLSNRRGNVLGLFEPIESERDFIRNKRILVVDDILTSGSTMNEAAKTLLIFGAEKIYVSSAVRTPKPKAKSK